VDEGCYIDFATLSSERINKIKVLGSVPKKRQVITAGLIFSQALSEEDVEVLSDDLSEIRDGFFGLYLLLIGDSSLPKPKETTFDRIKWWSWLETNFRQNPAALVLFVHKFVLEHHKEPFWHPLLKSEATLVAECKATTVRTPRAGAVAPQAKTRPAKQSKQVKQKVAPGSLATSNSRVIYTAAQTAKLATWKAKFPNVCLSRMVKGKNCYKEQHNDTCKFSHVCAWCASPSCKAMCSQAELL
jgi:hypothetical protein